MASSLKPRLLFIAILLIGAGFVSSCSSPDKNTIILAHAMNVQHPVAKGMRYMAQRLDSISHGRLKIKIYPNQQLGSERELLELVQVGTVDIAKVSAANMESFIPAYQIFSLPYLFRNKQHVTNVLWGKVGREILLRGTEQHFRGLTYYDAGLRSFYTRSQPIRKPSDLKGLKIRVQESPMAINYIKALNGSPTPISYGELYTALQSGIVDGAENNPPSYYSSRHYEVTKYYSLTKHTAVPDVLIAGTRFWNQLSEQEQQWVQQAADESADYQREIWEHAVEKSMQVFKENEVTIIEPDRQPFVNAVQPMYQQFKRKHPELTKLVNEIKNVGQQDEKNSR